MGHSLSLFLLPKGNHCQKHSRQWVSPYIHWSELGHIPIWRPGTRATSFAVQCQCLNTAAAAKSLQSCLTLCNPIDSSAPGSPIPGILQARTLGWCHFLLQCMKVKSEREVAQSCLTPSDPMDCSLPGSSIHGICQARVLEWGAIAFSA